MPRAKVRGGRKAHNKRIAKRRQMLDHIEQLKKKIIEEARERYIQEQKDKINEAR
jgi:hypothetical protein